MEAPRSRRTLVLVWAVVATMLALLSTGVAIFLALEAYRPGGEPGWSRWETSAGGNGHRYKAVPSTEGLTWKQADELARALGGYLATISSKAENEFVFNLVNAPGFFLRHGEGPALGGLQQDRSPEPEGGWGWVDGDAWSYSNWHATEPNNGRYLSGTEDRLQFYSGIPHTPAATWNDMNRDDRQMGGFIIERDD